MMSDFQWNGRPWPEELNRDPHQNGAVFLTQWMKSDVQMFSLQTSGSTGTPKTILKSKADLAASAKRTLEYLQIHRGNSLLILPEAFIAGKMMVVRSVLGGLHLHSTEPSIDLSKGLALADTFELIACTPQQLQHLSLQTQGLDLLNRCRHVLVGGTYFPERLAAWAGQSTAQIWESFGMTETVSHIALRNIRWPSKAFRPLPGVQVSQDQDGCLMINDRHQSDGMIHTQDLVSIEADGFRWLGRKDEVINSGGVKLHPGSMEQKIQDIVPSAFMIFGLPDPKWGERPGLVSNLPLTEDQKTQIQLRLSRLEQIREFIVVPHFPKNEQGKILRATLRKSLLNGA